MGELAIKNDKLFKAKEAGNTPLDVELFQNKEKVLNKLVIIFRLLLILTMKLNKISILRKCMLLNLLGSS